MRLFIILYEFAVTPLYKFPAAAPWANSDARPAHARCKTLIYFVSSAWQSHYKAGSTERRANG